MERLTPIKSTNNSIGSIKNLCKQLRITYQEFEDSLNLPDEEKYILASVVKSDGSLRKIHKPHHQIRKIQRRINNTIFKPLVLWPDYIFGCIPNELDKSGRVQISRDYVSCAEKHCQSKSILKVDIENFFDNVNSYIVKQMFIEFFKFNEQVSEALTNICTFKGSLVQGALTSSYIAALSLWDVEYKLAERLKRKGLVYTRLVDDITVSSTISNYKFDYALTNITKTLDEKELPINSNKTEVLYSSITPLIVHGMRVNFKEPRYPSNEVRKLKAAVYNIERLASEPGYRITFSYRRDFSRCMGRVNKLKRVKHNSHEKLIRRLNNILPLPAKIDIKRAQIIVARLKKDYKEKKNTYWYHRRFYRAHDRLNVLQRSYPTISKKLRLTLKSIKADYDI